MNALRSEYALCKVCSPQCCTAHSDVMGSCGSIPYQPREKKSSPPQYQRPAEVSSADIVTTDAESETENEKTKILTLHVAGESERVGSDRPSYVPQRPHYYFNGSS